MLTMKDKMKAHTAMKATKAAMKATKIPKREIWKKTWSAQHEGWRLLAIRIMRDIVTKYWCDETLGKPTPNIDAKPSEMSKVTWATAGQDGWKLKFTGFEDEIVTEVWSRKAMQGTSKVTWSRRSGSQLEVVTEVWSGKAKQGTDRRARP